MRAAFALALLLVAAGASAYNLMGVRWDDGDIPVPYAINQTLSGDVSDADALEAIQMGFNAWNVLPCSYMEWRDGGRTSNTSWGRDDGENAVTWRESGWGDSGGALAITMNNWGGGNRLSDTDIKFNGVNHSWAHFAGEPGNDGRTDIASVATHEIGHALGLDHTGVRGSTMWPSVTSGDIDSRTLGPDDIAGACAIYDTGEPVPDPNDLPPPSAGNADFGEDCTSEQCGSDLVCVTDGLSRYCSRMCDGACDAGYHCARLADGRGACARGPNPDLGRAEFGQSCVETACRSGLTCVRDVASAYCTQACSNGCPGGFACASTDDGRSICARTVDDGELPRVGEACLGGRCAGGLLCIRHDREPTCAAACDAGECPEGQSCVDAEPSGRVCVQRGAPPRPDTQPPTEDPAAPPGSDLPQMGQACVVAGGPACSAGLVCTGTSVEADVVVDPGYCTMACNAGRCCPPGWGCAPGIRGGRCVPFEADDDSLLCEKPAAEAEPEVAGGDGGCRSVPGAPLPLAWAWWLLVAIRRGRL